MTHTTAIVTPGVLISSVPYRIIGAQKETTITVTWTSNYATGGEVVPASETALNIFEDVISAEIVVPDAESTAVEPVVTINANTLVVKLNTAVAEIANALTITGLAVRVTVRGR